MADKIKGKGVISGIAVGTILLAGQNLDGYLVNYKPGKVEAEKKTAELDDLKNNPVEIIRTENVIPPNYVESKKALVDLQDRLAELQPRR